MSKRLSLTLPQGFDFALFDVLQALKDKYGVEIREEDEDCASGNVSMGEVSFKSPSVAPELVVQDAPILQLPLHVLANIANGLDPSSFVSLARSCRHLYNFYRQPSIRNQVNIRLSNETLYVHENYNGDTTFDYDSELDPVAMDAEDAEPFIESLRHWPFSVHIQKLEISNGHVFTARDVLTRLQAKSIYKLYISALIEFEDLVALIDDYNVKKLEWDDSIHGFTHAQTRILLQKPLVEIEMPAVPGNLLRYATIPTLRSFDSTITSVEVTTVIERFLSTDRLIDWQLEHTLDHAEFMTCFAEIPMFHVDYTGPLPQHRPLAFVCGGDAEDGHLIYHILRSDGKVIRAENNYTADIHIKIISLDEAPPIVSRA